MDDATVRQAVIDAGMEPDAVYRHVTENIKLKINFLASYLSSDTRDPQIVLSVVSDDATLNGHDYCRATLAECKRYLRKL